MKQEEYESIKAKAKELESYITAKADWFKAVKVGFKLVLNSLFGYLLTEFFESGSILWIAVSWIAASIGFPLLHVGWSFFRHRVSKRKSYSMSKSKSSGVDKAPKGFLIDLLLPPDRAEDALFNLFGRYNYWVAKHGVRKARVIFTVQSIIVVITYWSDWVLKRLKLFDLFRRS